MRQITIATIAALSVTIANADTSAKWTCDNGGIVPGLYGATGSLLTTTTSIDSIEYRLTYRTTPGVATYYPSFQTKTYRARITVKFTNSQWRGVSGASFGVKVMNYAALGAAPLEQILGSIGDGLSSVVISPSTGSGLPPSESSRTFADVNPRMISVASLTPDPSDKTGQSGYLEFDSPAKAGSSWWSTDIPAGRTGSWFSAVWLFPQWGAKGLYDRKDIQTYPVEQLVP